MSVLVILMFECLPYKCNVSKMKNKNQNITVEEIKLEESKINKKKTSQNKANKFTIKLFFFSS